MPNIIEMATKRIPREFTRTRTNLSVQVVGTNEETLSSGKSRDLSLNGVFLECSQKLPLGSNCQIIMVLDASDQDGAIQARGQVSRVDTDGMAIHFNELPMDSYEKLRNLLICYTSEASGLLDELPIEPEGSRN